MKKVLMVLSVVMLTGCSTLQTAFDSYFMARYDNQEYVLINKIRTTAELAQSECDNFAKAKIEFINLQKLNREFKNFTQYIPRNPEAYKLAVQMEELINQGNKSYDDKSSVFFCKAKFQQIERNAEKIQKVLGSKPR